jgi:hypothetical protein
MDEIKELKRAMQVADNYFNGEIEIKGTMRILGDIEKSIRNVKRKMAGEKADCFAYRNGKCIALKEMICKKKQCPFYKKGEHNGWMD